MKTLSYIAVLALTLTSFTTLNAQDENKTGIVAHRGFWNCEEAGFAKNSVAALKCAQEAGFWGSEFDVNMTADGVLLVYHDGEIDGKKIEKHEYAEFKDIKICNGEYIPTIDDILEQGKKYPETILVYELKTHSCDAVENRLIDITIDKLAEHGLLDPERVMFISFSLHICKEIAQRLPNFDVQFLGSTRSPSRLEAMGINGIDYNHMVFSVKKKWHRQAKRRGMDVNAWTVNKEKDMIRMLTMGVDQLTTDYPLQARSIMEKMEITEEL